MVGKLLIWSAVYQARIGAMHNQACCTAKKVTIRLSRQSDADLARIGLTREDIPQAVLRGL
ncbi:MAG: hypothetical protein B7Z15_23960 [Rhizobiales bacterium 32-66-8]|nr:MAG: hypothetical protein B7Z15_23960 [Rhizobiales bacterium 32-66-8]